MRISAIQMNPGADKAQNLAQARELIQGALADGRPRIVALPEMWTCLGGDRAKKFAAAETLPPEGSNAAGGEAYECLREVARANKIHVHGGSIAELAGDLLYNTTVVFDPNGVEIARYRKIHLFDIVTPDGMGYRESATFKGGDRVVTFKAHGTTCGLAICYDIRFPELFLKLRQAGAEIIFLPAAFTVPTGRDHWEVLLQARAIETQSWIVAPACWGRHLDGSGEPRMTFGRTLIADPWGLVTARVPDGTGWITSRADATVTERIRRDMPVLAHRKFV
ncbi:carbon-nitrogen hydrolase family protein [Acidisoma cellulosilytica]|uniref:Carbon-nitrogen hydrolase family protein n=1 Tax=Acidisoma cellulosilyticum TaxID=2802395 RepID=A0A963Z181_9PROT|nr:carbon-nitrogen hydrolase family protein [Acidisoma cellulosilyticum]MCB8880840.1 carbon-nitrogen hydrolase family protein [Acidisoma cellulosilyticum]